MTSPTSADRCASMPQVRSFSVGVAPEAGLLFGSLMADLRLSPAWCMELQLRPDARKYSHARLEKSDWILVVPVKKIVDATKHGQLPAESETRREIHRRIPGRIQARDRKVAVA